MSYGYQQPGGYGAPPPGYGRRPEGMARRLVRLRKYG